MQRQAIAKSNEIAVHQNSRHVARPHSFESVPNIVIGSDNSPFRTLLAVSRKSNSRVIVAPTEEKAAINNEVRESRKMIA